MGRFVQGLILATLSSAVAHLAVAGPVNINTADAEELAAELRGIGPALAAEIIRDREENGRYERPEEITRVRGIGQRVLEDNIDYILVEDAPE